MTRAFISLGSNLGDRKKNILKAVEELGQVSGIQVRRMSRLYETEPVGKTDQPKFLNAVVEIESELSAEALLDRMLGVETLLGRVRKERWGPRTIDLDLLLFGDARIDTPRLTVPHPRMTERRFVLEPLAELEPDRVLPGDDQTVRQRLANLSREN
jgi:2-amino-4-hydroxy-6-hydroxymethyldihydropteridine diphosphokinase